jgi:hypothetical protein
VAQSSHHREDLPMHANTRLKPARQANKGSDLEIIYRPLSELKLDPTNPRLRSKKTDLANQRKRQGFRRNCR